MRDVPEEPLDREELLDELRLSICRFRYVPAELPNGPEREELLDRLNERLDRNPARRALLLLERHPPRAVLAARLHRQLPARADGAGGAPIRARVTSTTRVESRMASQDLRPRR